MPTRTGETTFELKGKFFDRDAVINAMDDVTHKAFHIAAATVRKTAIRSMRRQKKPSPPGRPPAFHDSNAMTLRYILYGWDARRKSILIGPTKHPNSKRAISIPKLHEFGGTAPISEWRLIPANEKSKKRVEKNPKLKAQFYVWLNGGSKVVAIPKTVEYITSTRTRDARYPKRPYMRPALEKIRRTLPHLFRGQLRPSKKVRHR